MGRAERSEKCEAAAGLTREASGIIESRGEAPAKDVVLSEAGRKTEHYEIASYRGAVSMARKLGMEEVAQLLGATLEEERSADKKLEKIGKRLARASAMKDTDMVSTFSAPLSQLFLTVLLVIAVYAAVVV